MVLNHVMLLTRVVVLISLCHDVSLCCGVNPCYGVSQCYVMVLAHDMVLVHVMVLAYDRSRGRPPRLLFGVTRRSRSDESHSLTELLIGSIDFTDVTLVSEDTYRRLH